MLIVASVLLLVIPAIVGIQALEWHHAVARLRVTGVTDSGQLAAVETAVARVPGHRRSRLEMIQPGGEVVCNIELEFHAGSKTEATVRLWQWQEQFHPPVEVEIEQVSYRTLCWPGRGGGTGTTGNVVPLPEPGFPREGVKSSSTRQPGQTRGDGT